MLKRLLCQCFTAVYCICTCMWEIKWKISLKREISRLWSMMMQMERGREFWQMVLTRFTFRSWATVQWGEVCSSLRNEAGASRPRLLSVQALHAVQYLIQVIKTLIKRVGNNCLTLWAILSCSFTDERDLEKLYHEVTKYSDLFIMCSHTDRTVQVVSKNMLLLFHEVLRACQKSCYSNSTVWKSIQ